MWTRRDGPSHYALVWETGLPCPYGTYRVCNYYGLYYKYYSAGMGVSLMAFSESKIRIVPSCPVLTRVLPSGENTNVPTVAVCPLSVIISLPVVISNNSMLLFLSPVTRTVSSGEKTICRARCLSPQVPRDAVSTTAFCGTKNYGDSQQ